MLTKLLPTAAMIFLLGGWSGLASANLVSNGDFSAGSTGWNPTIVSGYASGTGLTFDGSVAELGKTGTPGEAEISQGFSVSGTQQVLVEFDYQWFSSNAPATDQFSVTLTGGSGDQTVFSELSGAGTFNQEHFSQVFTVTGAGGILFNIQEFNTSVGTLVELDNVSLTVVPLPAAAWLFGSALFGLLAIARRRAA